MMTGRHFGRLRTLAPLLLLLSCASPAPSVIPTPVAPVQIAACMTFVIEDETPQTQTEYERRIRDDVRKAVQEELVAAGFTVVANDTYPHDLVAKLSTEPGSAVAEGAQLRARLSLATDYAPVVAIDAQTPQEGPDHAARVAERLVDQLFQAPEVGKFARDMRRPGVEQVSARLRVEHEAAVAAALSPPPTSSAPAAPAAPLPEPPPAAPTYVAGASQPDAYALVIGIESYKSGLKAPGARADAERFAEVARVSLGVPADHISLMVGEQASRTGIDAYIGMMRLQIPRGSRIYFYFSGIATTERTYGSAYVLPYEGDVASVETSGYRLWMLLNGLGDTKAKEVFAFVDAATSGLGTRSAPAKGEQAPVKTRDEDAPPHVILLGAASPGEIATTYKASSQGLFTHYLVEGIGKARADVDGDGDITVAELSQWLRPRVTRDAKAMNQAQSALLSLGSGVSLPARIAVASGLASP